jgi:hypothetical protein
MHSLFDGVTADPELDDARLTSLLDRVRQLMLDGKWRTLREIADALGHGSEASISARLRDLRKPKFGGLIVESRRRYTEGPTSGVWETQVRKP